MKIAHISDLHYSHASFSPAQFFSKRWLGNLNLVLSRKRSYDPKRLELLPGLWKSLGVDLVLITGDVSTTALPEEFALASTFATSCKKEGIHILALPGNHDCYTKGSCSSKRFYKFFDPCWEEKSLQKDRLSTILIGGVVLIGLDTSKATSLVSSEGYFDEDLELLLENTLSSLPRQQPVFLANHFPFFAQPCARRNLVRRDALKNLIQRFPQIKLYLHGHTHRHCLADLRAHNLPLILDSGSTSHKSTGMWNLIDYTPHGAHISAYNWNHGWVAAKQLEFTW